VSLYTLIIFSSQADIQGLSSHILHISKVDISSKYGGFILYLSISFGFEEKELNSSLLLLSILFDSI
jgi:hypothetical protein